MALEGGRERGREGGQREEEGVNLSSLPPSLPPSLPLKPSSSPCLPSLPLSLLRPGHPVLGDDVYCAADFTNKNRHLRKLG